MVRIKTRKERKAGNIGKINKPGSREKKLSIRKAT